MKNGSRYICAYDRVQMKSVNTINNVEESGGQVVDDQLRRRRRPKRKRKAVEKKKMFQLWQMEGHLVKFCPSP